MSWVLAIGGFALLVVLHEAGHMLAAKAVGMRVERFFLFFPPKLISFTRGETEYGIGAIPLGGFVKITGMNPEEEMPPEVAARAYYHQPVWKRIVVIAAGPVVNIVLALVIFFVIAAGFGLDGELTNRVDTVDPALPAAAALQPGDRLLTIDGTDVGDLHGIRLADTVRGQLAEHTCAGTPKPGCTAQTPAVLRVERDGSPLLLRITPTYQVFEPPEVPKTEGRMVLGFNYDAERIRETIGGAADFAVTRLWDVTSQTAQVFAQIADPEQRKQITGVVGATEVAQQSFSFDTRQALFVLGVISLSLGLVNLLPFLPLDGGHIFWALVEKIRGRPVAFAVMERSGIIGFALVMALFVIGLQNDIGRLAGDGFNVR